MTQRPLDVLMVEDNPADAELASEALAEAGWSVNLSVVADGEQALAYLERKGPYHDAARPALIFLDLNLPRLDGREVLRYVKSHDELKGIPVVVLTTSAAQEDIDTAYQLHANSYLIKPANFDEFVSLVRTTQSFWASAARLPR